MSRATTISVEAALPCCVFFWGGNTMTTGIFCLSKRKTIFFFFLCMGKLPLSANILDVHVPSKTSPVTMTMAAWLQSSCSTFSHTAWSAHFDVKPVIWNYPPCIYRNVCSALCESKSLSHVTYNLTDPSPERKFLSKQENIFTEILKIYCCKAKLFTSHKSQTKYFISQIQVFQLVTHN